MTLSELKKGKTAYIKNVAPEAQEVYDRGIIPGISIELVRKSKTTHSLFKIDTGEQIIIDDHYLDLIEIYF